MAAAADFIRCPRPGAWSRWLAPPPAPGPAGWPLPPPLVPAQYPISNTRAPQQQMDQGRGGDGADADVWADVLPPPARFVGRGRRAQSERSIPLEAYHSMTNAFNLSALNDCSTGPSPHWRMQSRPCRHPRPTPAVHDPAYFAAFARFPNKQLIAVGKFERSVEENLTIF